jgi:hypothetical protein
MVGPITRLRYKMWPFRQHSRWEPCQDIAQESALSVMHLLIRSPQYSMVEVSRLGVWVVDWQDHLHRVSLCLMQGQQRLGACEGFGVRHPALNPTKPRQPNEDVVVPPITVLL